MKFVKTSLSNCMGDAHLSNILICYLEKEELMKVTNDAMVHRFMNMEGKDVDLIYKRYASIFHFLVNRFIFFG